MIENQVTQKCIAAYELHRNLKLAANEVGIPWQTVYVHLRRAGVPVTGDKLRYGSDSDKLAARAEKLFLKHVPNAEDQNTRQFQSKVDFMFAGLGIDVKASRKKQHGVQPSMQRWMFIIKKQEAIADFFVCYGFDGDGLNLEQTLLIPGELARNYTSISVSTAGGKWADYAVDPDSLAEFFSSLS
ncbi:MAG: riboflavin synthase subunit alpha [Caudoviricetes sp.]|nr:MAG: riboflavin synthase subunit alpha [Caudoviricetes sp.]